MRPAVLSISAERVLAPIRNTVLAHAGYGVIPATNAESGLKILQQRHVCAMIIGHSVTLTDQQTLCSEARKLGVPAVVMDPYEHVPRSGLEVHVNPLDGPEMFLDALATLAGRGQEHCAGPTSH